MFEAHRQAAARSRLHSRSVPLFDSFPGVCTSFCSAIRMQGQKRPGGIAGSKVLLSQATSSQIPFMKGSNFILKLVRAAAICSFASAALLL